MDGSKRARYQKLYKIARRKLEKTDVTSVQNQDSDTDSNDDLPVQISRISHFAYTEYSPNQQIVQQQSVSLSQPTESDLDEPFNETVFNKIADSDSEKSICEPDFEQKLQTWACDFNLTHNAVDELLKLLRSNGHSTLPATARTFFRSSTSIETKVISGMDYYFFGFKTQLIKYIKYASAADIIVPSEIHISLNIDGLPLFRSSKKSLWPILASIANIDPKVVFPVAITCGDKKPNNLDFLCESINELKSVISEGITIENNDYTILLSCIVCDAPARSMVKGTKLYSGYFGCDKCEQRGEYFEGKVTFPLHKNVDLRSDERFRARRNEEHHHHRSPFCELPIDMVVNFPIDYMHQACLGVTKKLLIAWIRGKRQNRLSSHQKDLISSRLVNLQCQIPSYFARKPRSLEEIDHWKATEFRQFLLYTGRVVLRGILKPQLYSHFIHLSVAICILTSKRLNSIHNDLAKQLLDLFLSQCLNIYGGEFMVYNVHCLSHISSDAAEFECLDNCSAFPYENYLQQLKKKIRSSRRPLVQVVKRIQENEQLKNPYHIKIEHPISTKKSDNAYILNDSTVCKVMEEGHIPNTFKCEVYSQTQSAFSVPANSKLIGVHRVFTSKRQFRNIPATDLKRRAL